MMTTSSVFCSSFGVAGGGVGTHQDGFSSKHLIKMWYH